MPPTHPFRRAAALVGAALVLAAGITCSEAPTGPRTKSGVYALVGMSPVFSQAATQIHRRLASFELEIDNVHIKLERENGQVAVDTLVALTAGQDSVVIKLSVEILEGTQEQFDALLEFRDGTQVLFSGTQTITAALGFAPPAVPPITIEYTGPGAAVTTLDVQPDTTISGTDDVTMRAIGRDANEQVVANLNLEWSVNNANLGSITAAGVFQPTGTAGNAVITAALPTGIEASATVTISPASTVVVVSGGGQTGQVGTTLEVPIVVEVQSTTGGPVPGHTVSFAVSGGGGSIAPPSVTTGTNGRASAFLTLGTSAGTNTVQITAAGLTPISATATGVAGAATKVTISQQPSSSAVSGELLGTQPKAQLQDAFGNNVASANVAITADLNPAGNFTLQGTTTRTTNASGRADFTDLNITGPTGTTALRFSASGLTSVTSSNISVTEVGPSVVSWINPEGGFWSVASNWSTGVVPTSTDIVAIDLPGTYNIAVNVNAVAASLTLGAASGTQTLTISNPGTLTVNGSSVVNANGVLRVADASFASSGTVTNHGTLWTHGSNSVPATFASATLDNRGTVLIWNGLTEVTGPLVTTSGSVIRVFGASANSSAGAARLTVSNGFTNDGLLELTSDHQSSGAQLTVTNGPLVNAEGAAIRSLVGTAGGSSRTLTATLVNHGELDVEQPLTINGVSSTHVNSGTIDLTVGSLTVNQSGTSPSFTNTGSVTLAGGHNWTVNGGTLDVDEGTVTAGGRLIVSDATLAFTFANVLANLRLTNATIEGGALSIPTGRMVTLFNGALHSALTVPSGGVFVVHGASSLTQAVTLSEGGTIRVGGQGDGNQTSNASLTVLQGFTNSGLIELTSANTAFNSTLTVQAGTLTNAAGATIRSSVGGGGSRTLDAQLLNEGTLDVEQDLQMGRSDSDITNTGTIDLSLASLNVTQSGETPTFTNLGLMTLGAGRTWLVTGGLVDLDEGSLAGEVTSRVLIFNASLALTTANIDEIPLTLVSTTIVGGSITVPAGELLTLWDATLTDPVTVENGGTLLTHGVTALNGALTLLGSSVIKVQGQNGSTDAILTVANGFTNSGLIELTSIHGVFSATLAITTGPLTNAAGGTIRSSVGTGGARTLAAQLNNQNGATLDVDQPLTIDRASSAHYNSGSIDLTNANLTVTQTGTAPTFGNGIIGIITLGANRQFIVNGGQLNLLGSSVVQGQPTSTLVVTNAVLQFTAQRVTVPLTLTNTTILGGSITLITGETLKLLNGGLSDAVNLGGGTLVAHGNVSLSGAVSVQSGSTLRVQGQSNGSHASLTAANSFTNNGVIELTSADAVFDATLSVTSGTLTNATGATILAAQGAGGARAIDAEILNQGYLEVNQELRLGRNGANHVNGNIVALNAGNLTISQTGGSFTNNGSINLVEQRVLTVNGTTLDADQGTISGPATADVILLLDGTTLTYGPSNVTIPILFVRSNVTGGNITLGDGQALTLWGGTLPANVTVNSGGLLLVHSAATLTGTLAIESGSVVVRGQNFGGDASLTVANGFTNNGFIELTSVDLAFSSTLAVTNGSLSNGVEATISSTFGNNGGQRTLAAQLNNQGGFVDVYHPLTIDKPNAQHVNGANTFIRLYNGDLTITQSGTGQSFTNSGTIELLGHTLTNTGGPFVNTLADAMAIIGPGTLNVGTTFLNNGEVRPSGVLNVTGNYLQSNPSGVLNIQISPSQSSACEVNDQVVSTGAASLAGSLNVFFNDCLFSNGQTFTILTAASHTGTFSYTPISIQGGVLNIDYATPTSVRLRFDVP